MVEKILLSSSRAEVRRLLSAILITEADFTSFCLDFFPDLQKRFSDRMDRLSKTNLLLEIASPVEIVTNLKKQAPDLAISFRDSIAGILGDHHEQRLHQLKLELEAALGIKEKLLGDGSDTSEVDKEILAIRREQRRGSRLNEGEILAGRYKLLQVVGTGGFADVWQAIDRRSQRLVAVKVLHSQWKNERSRTERFERGACRMADLRHPHIVHVLSEPQEDQGFLFFIMEYLSGGDLRNAILFQKFSKEKMLQNIIEVGMALEYAHQNGLIHRDVKPQNILLDDQEKARLTDFDLVGGLETTGGTGVGGLGTLIYAAPEQMDDASNADHRADTYSLAMVTLSVLRGRELPFRAVRYLDSFIKATPCSIELQEILLRATSWDIQERHDSTENYCIELQKALEKPQTSKCPNDSTDIVNFKKSAPAQEHTIKEVTIDFQEGVWRADDGSTFCIKQIDGIIRCAYCYLGSDHLTGHIVNGIIIGHEIFGTFQWINSPEIRGYIYLQLTFKDVLMGGWCYADNFSLTKREHFVAHIKQAIRTRDTTTLMLRHMAKVNKMPSWAEKYFNKYVPRRHR